MEEETLEILYRAPGEDEYFPVARALDKLFNLVNELQEEIKELKLSINNQKN